MNWKGILSKAFLSIIVLVCIAHLAMLYYGIAHITTTLFIYIIVGFILYKLTGYIGRKYNTNTARNIQFSILSLLFFLFIGELVLRYVVKLNLTRKETLSGFYSSEYKRHLIRSHYNKYIKGFDQGWYFTNKPLSQNTVSEPEFTYTYNYNSFGLPSEEVLPTDTGNLIITIGDSFTEGIGAPQDSSWPYQLSYILKNDTSLPLHLVMNAGKSGSDICYEYVLLQKVLETYSPKTVILALNTTDVDDIIIRGGINRFQPGSTIQYKKAPLWEPIYATSFIARALLNTALDLDWTLLTKEQKPRAEQEAINAINNTLAQFSIASKNKGFQLIVLLNPLSHEISSPSPLYQQLASTVNAEKGIEFIDLRRGFLKDGRITVTNYHQYYWPIDGHNNAAGYKIWAEIVASHLQETLKQNGR